MLITNLLISHSKRHQYFSTGAFLAFGYKILLCHSNTYLLIIKCRVREISNNIHSTIHLSSKKQSTPNISVAIEFTAALISRYTVRGSML